MQKGKADASPRAMILQIRAPQQNACEPPTSQQRSDDDNPGQVQSKRTENRWVRQGQRIKIGSEEERKTEVVFCKVRGILNKLTPQKFRTLTQQIIDLDIDTPERLEGCVDLIFEQAICAEGAFSVPYANMCRCLVPKKVVVEKEGVKKDISFRKILLNRCQKEFEKEKSVEKRIHEKLEHLSKEGLTEEELEAKKKELLGEELLAKRRTLGNIRFIGELFKLKMLTESIMHDCVVKLLKRNDEESFECLCKLLLTIGKYLDHVKAKHRIDKYFRQIKEIIQARVTSSRVRFMMQDVVDLRHENWVSRKEDNSPKTIDELHKEAADKAKKARLKIQLEKKIQRGCMGGRDSPRPSIPQANETWTTMGRGPRNVNVRVDPKKFQNIKRPVDCENISVGPGGRGCGAWARGNGGGSGVVGAGAGPSASTAAALATDADNKPTNRYSALAGERKHSDPATMSPGDPHRQEPRSPLSGGGRRGPLSALEGEKLVRSVTQPKRSTQARDGDRGSSLLKPEAETSLEASVIRSAVSAPVQELTVEDMEKKSVAIIEEYLYIKDMVEVAFCLRELQSPSVHYVFVGEILNHTMEKRASHRIATGKLLHFLLRDGVLIAQQYLQGLEQILEYAEDIEIDIPQLWNYLGELLGASAFDGNIDLNELFKCVLRYVSNHKAAKLFAFMLQTATNDTSREDVSAILNRYEVSLNTFFENEEEVEQFAKDQNIEFALGQGKSPFNTGSSKQHFARIQEELRTLILRRKARNYEVFNWIDKNVSSEDAKAPPFIRALVTVVCEGAMEREDGGVCKCNIYILKERKPLLQKYIDDNASLEIQAVYAVQALFVQLDHPPSFVKSYFDSLYDEEIITEDSFKAWENSSDEEPGKGVTLSAASQFFRWLKIAPEEPGETADEVRNKEAQQSSLAAAGEVKPERKEKSEETTKDPVDFSLPMGSPAQMRYHRPQQPLQGQFAPVSVSSQPQGSPYFQPTTVYQVGQPTPPMYIERAPPGPMTGMPQYQAQTFEPRVRERKIIQIKYPNSNKDVTQEIFNRQPSGSLTGSTCGTPTNITPDISAKRKGKKQKHHLKEIEKPSSIPPRMDMMEAYAEKPVQKEVPGETEEQAAEETTQTLQEEAGEEEQSEEETWGDREGPSKHLTLRELGMERYLSDMRTQLREVKEKLEVKNEQLKRTEDQLREKDEQQEALQRQLTTLRAEKETKEKESAKFQEQLGIKLKELTDLEKEFRDSVQDQVDLKRDLSAAKEKLSKYESQLMTRDWIISRHEIEIMTDRSLGEGGYGMVFKGRYRGFVVAVKTLKDFTLNAGGRDLFEREMDIASRCRHPCLLQFIGATQDETPLLVTELMELSLRKLLRERQLSEKEIVVISLDVAHALNYLHNRKIVHRDVSSANVLLWKQNDQWRGKLGDYGTVKFLQEVMTKSPGAMIYSAPEAGSPFNQTVKIDVYSFGVLFCEMFTRKIPFSYERKKHVDLVPNRPGGEFQDLVLWCTEEYPARRPSMETVIKRLETFITTI